MSPRRFHCRLHHPSNQSVLSRLVTHRAHTFYRYATKDDEVGGAMILQCLCFFDHSNSRDEDDGAEGRGDEAADETAE